MSTIPLRGMGLTHPIDAEIRAWLKAHVKNKADLSVKVGRSSSWLHKLTEGDGHATIDDLVRMAALLFGMNLPVLTDGEQSLLKSVRGLKEREFDEVLEYARHRARLARHDTSTQSSEPATQTTTSRGHKARGRRKAAGE